MSTTHRDWIPQNRHTLAINARQAHNYLVDDRNTDRMGFVENSPQKAWLDTVFIPSYRAFGEAYMRWEEPATRTPVMTREMNETEALFIPAYRQLYIGFMKGNPLVTDADLDAMGMPVYNNESSAHTPSPVPVTAPALTVDISLHSQLTVHYQDAEKSGKGKPAGVHGLELKWVVAEEQPASEEGFIHSTSDTHSPVALKFNFSQQGARVYLVARWENTRGEKGPWCEVVSAVIP